MFVACLPRRETMSAVLLLFLERQKIEIRTLPVGGDDVSEALAKP